MTSTPVKVSKSGSSSAKADTESDISISSTAAYKDSTASVGVKRAQWGSNLQFLFTCIGYAVGLGNIWRFPMQAYENGGGAFLIPYFVCSMILGFPIVYLEMTLGQYVNSGPAEAHGHIRPICQGIGWGMVAVTALVSVYYNVILAWDLLYMYMIITGQSWKWATCTNYWNSDNCISFIHDKNCSDQNPSKPYWQKDAGFVNGGICLASRTLATTITATEDFFNNFILQKSEGIDDIGGFNWQLCLALALAWILTCLALLWGVKVMGNLAYVTGTLPYIIIAILFGRGVSLKGAGKGIEYYLTKPDLSKVLLPSSWKNAAVQLCFSMAIGMGGFISLSSFNAKKHNCYRDALIVCAADSFMSVFGGVAVFSILGFMASNADKPIDKVVKSGTGLAFIAYPEAMSQMPVPWLWSFLFFTMIFLLGISSQFGFAETVCTAIYDQFPHTRPYKWIITVSVCSSLFVVGLIFATKAGIYYFNIVSEYASSFSVMALALMEVMLICYVYGLNNYIEKDLRQMFGPPRSMFGRIFGPTGYYIQTVWCFFTPLLLFIIFMILFKDQIHMQLKWEDYIYPGWASTIGWVIAFIPFLMFPFTVCYDLYKYRKYERSWRDLFRLHPKWPSYYEQIKLPRFTEPLQNLTISESENEEDNKQDEMGKDKGASASGIVKRKNAVKEMPN